MTAADRSAPPPTAGRDTQAVAARAVAGHVALVLVVRPAGTGRTTTLVAAVDRLRAEPSGV